MTQATPKRPSFAEDKRAEIRARANAMGIDEAYLSRMVDEFYTRIRRDPRLGPIFASRIGDNWDPHLARMKTFWESVALNNGDYHGQPVPVHRALPGVERTDFAIWLGIFERVLDDTSPSGEASAYLLLRARRIARSLEMAMFDRIGGSAPPRLVTGGS